MSTAFALLLTLTVLTSAVGWATRLFERRRGEAGPGSATAEGSGESRARALAASVAVAAVMNEEGRGPRDAGGRPR